VSTSISNIHGHGLRILKGGDEERRLCDPLPPVTAVLYYRWLAAGLHDKILSQGIGGHRVYAGIRHPLKGLAYNFQVRRL